MVGTEQPQNQQGLNAGFWRNTSGNTTIILAIASSVLLTVAGGAIDFARWSSAKVEVQQELDAAVLAGTQKLLEGSGNRKAALDEARVFFAKAMKRTAPLIDNKVDFKINDAGNGVVSKGTAFIETSLLKVIGLSKLQVVEDAAAEAATSGGTAASNLEIALVLDVTGSMCADGTGPCTSGSKFTALKKAASDLITTVVSDSQSTYTSRVSIVPFNTAIRVGPDGGGAAMMEKMTNLPATWSGWYKSCISGYTTTTTEGENSWICTQEGPAQMNNEKIIPCVTGRYYESGIDYFDATDDAPASGKWILANDGTRALASEDSSDTAMTSDLGQSSSDLSTSWNYGDSGACAKTAEANELMPLSSNKPALLTKIDSLVAQGSTSAQLGTTFGWYSISPKWSSVWGSDSAAGSYDDLTTTNASGAPTLRKIAIIMTDGDNNAYRGWINEGYKAKYAEYTIAACTAMKDAGVEIFTVGYELDALPATDRDRAANILEKCGSDVQHFYDSLSASQLKDAFASIANSITGSAGGLRLSR